MGVSIVIQAVEFEAHGYKKYRKVWHINISQLEVGFMLYRMGKFYHTAISDTFSHNYLLVR